MLHQVLLLRLRQACIHPYLAQVKEREDPAMVDGEEQPLQLELPLPLPGESMSLVLDSSSWLVSATVIPNGRQ